MAERPVRALALAALKPAHDFALPPRCPGCGAITGEPHRFCFDCWSHLEFLGDPCCACCGLPFGFGAGGDELCGACLSDPPDFDRMRAAVAYGDIPRKVALKLKYGGRPGVAETIARFVERHMPAEPDVLLAPVPLHRWRIWKRGYNQAALIASAPGGRSGREAKLDLVERAKATPPLRGKNPPQRRDAVRGAFRASPGRSEVLRGRTVMLVDDVFTSGATAGACARVLKRAGAARVEILCWARVVKEE